MGRHRALTCEDEFTQKDCKRLQVKDRSRQEKDNVILSESEEKLLKVV